MDYAVLVEMDQGVDCLSDVVGGLAFGEKPFLSQDIEKRRLPDLKNEIDILILLIKLVKLQTVLMLQIKLYLNLSNESLNQLRRNFLQADLLSRIDRPSLIMHSKADIPKAALPQNFAHLELFAKGIAMLDFTQDTRSLRLFLIRDVLVCWG